MNLRTPILMLSMCLASFCYGQKTDTTYYDTNSKPVAKAGSSFYRIAKFVKENTKYEVTDYYTSGQIKMTGTFSSLSPEIKDGVFTWYKDGQKQNETIFERGRVKSKRFLQGESKPVPPPPATFGFNLLEGVPTYPGSMQELYKYIGNNFVYPK